MKKDRINLNSIHPMSHRQDLLKRIEALEISRKLIDDEIAQAKNSLEQIEAKQQAAWE